MNLKSILYVTLLAGLGLCQHALSMVAGPFTIGHGGAVSVRVTSELPPTVRVGAGGAPTTVRNEEGIIIPLQKGFGYDTPSAMVQDIQKELANVYLATPDASLQERIGSITFGRDPKKWLITVDGKPLESYAKEAVIVNDDNKMAAIYRNGLRAVYNEAPGDTIKHLENAIAQKQAEIQELQAQVQKLKSK